MTNCEWLIADFINYLTNSALITQTVDTQFVISHW
jgi:hypothetical protein